MQVPGFVKAGKYLEAFIGLSIILIMIAVFFNRINSISAKIEQTGMDQSLSAIRMELQLFSFQQMMAGNEALLSAYEGANPIDLLNVVPRNYFAKLPLPGERELPAGSWYYNKEANELRYKLINASQFYQGGKNISEARYRLKFFFQDNDNNNKYDPNIDKANGLTIVPMGEYVWR